jgi:DNA-binding MarR family transcriptional regulator
MSPDEHIVEAIERLMFESVGVTTIALTRASPEIELSFPQWRALVVVGSSQDGMRVGEIANRIGSAVPSTSRLLRRLERRRLVVTERDETDRRATRVRLAPAGNRIRRSLVEQRRQLVRDALAARATPLPTDLLHGLREIGQALEGYE